MGALATRSVWIPHTIKINPFYAGNVLTRAKGNPAITPEDVGALEKFVSSQGKKGKIGDPSLLLQAVDSFGTDKFEGVNNAVVRDMGLEAGIMFVENLKRPYYENIEKINTIMTIGEANRKLGDTGVLIISEMEDKSKASNIPEELAVHWEICEDPYPITDKGFLDTGGFRTYLGKTNLDIIDARRHKWSSAAFEELTTGHDYGLRIHPWVQVFPTMYPEGTPNLDYGNQPLI